MMNHSASQASLSIKAVEKERIKNQDKGKNRERGFFILGTLSLIAVVVLWSLSSAWTSHVLESYDQPFVLTAANCLSFMVYFVFLVLPDPLIYILQQKREIDEERDAAEASGVKSDSATVVSSAESSKLPPLTLAQTARVSFVFFLIYFASNFLFNFSLGSGSVSRVSNLISTSGFFTLILGYYWGVEQMSVLRLGAVVLSFGAALVTIVPSFELSGTVTQACFFALSSAFAYGCYSIYLKIVTKDESRVSMPILFAFVGLYTLLLVVPVAAVFHVTGLNEFKTPRLVDLKYILLNAVFGGLLPNYMWNVAFAFTTPLVVAIGLSFSTPLGLLSSWYLGQAIDAEDYLASVVVILSFAVLNVASLNKQLDAKIDRKVLSFFVSSSSASSSSAAKDATVTSGKRCDGCKCRSAGNDKDSPVATSVFININVNGSVGVGVDAEVNTTDATEVNAIDATDEVQMNSCQVNSGGSCMKCPN